MIGVLPWLVRWALHAGTQEIFYAALAALIGPLYKIYFSLPYVSIHLSPSPSKLGRVTCLLICVSGANNARFFRPFFP
jgi:hypothetical protein